MYASVRWGPQGRVRLMVHNDGSGFDRKAVTLTSALLAAAYFVAGKVGLTLAFVNASATAVWPPAGIAVAAFLVLGHRVWPGILLGAFLVNLTTTGGIPSSVGIAVGNTIEGLVGSYLVARFANGRRVFERPSDVFKFAALAAVLSPAIAATIGATSLLLTGNAARSDFGGIWLTWCLGDAGGVLIVGPLLVLWSASSLGPWRSGRGLEAVLLALALVVTGLVLFGGFLGLSANNYPLEFLVFPLLAWVAFRFGPRETAAVTCLLSAIAIWGTLRGFGPFAGHTQNESLLLVQTFIALAAVPSLVLAAAIRERRRAEEAIRYLADASVQLAGSLDYSGTLRRVVRLPVPALADCCIVTTASDSEVVEKVVISYQDPSNRQPLEDLLRRYPFDPDEVRSGQSAVYPEIQDAHLVTAAHDAEHLRRLRELGLKCAMILPLVARRQTLGTISLYSTRPGRHYGEADLALGEDLAHRTAMALDNAHLYAEQCEIVGRLNELHGRLEAFERERLLEDERHRIARELHDRVEQIFFGIGLTARATLNRADDLAEPVRSRVATVLALADRGADQLREAIFALNRADVDAVGLTASLWRLVRDFRKRSGLEADLALHGREHRVSPEIAELLYAVALEALSNVERHAGASAVVISLWFEPGTAWLSVQDDGRGASPLVLRTLSDSAIHFGLQSLRQRVKSLGGDFSAQAGEDGGFVVRVRLAVQETALHDE